MNQDNMVPGHVLSDKHSMPIPATQQVGGPPMGAAVTMPGLHFSGMSIPDMVPLADVASAGVIRMAQQPTAEDATTALTATSSAPAASGNGPASCLPPLPLPGGAIPGSAAGLHLVPMPAKLGVPGDTSAVLDGMLPKGSTEFSMQRQNAAAAAAAVAAAAAGTAGAGAPGSGQEKGPVMTPEQLETLRRQICVYAIISQQLVAMYQAMTTQHLQLSGVLAAHHQYAYDPAAAAAAAAVAAATVGLPGGTVGGLGGHLGGSHTKSRQRWTPQPAQLQILEEHFRLSAGTPNKAKIREITAELLKHGQISETNVYNWFQNRKARAKRKSGANASGANGAEKDGDGEKERETDGEDGEGEEQVGAGGGGQNGREKRPRGDAEGNTGDRPGEKGLPPSENNTPVKGSSRGDAAGEPGGAAPGPAHSPASAYALGPEGAERLEGKAAGGVPRDLGGILRGDAPGALRLPNGGGVSGSDPLVGRRLEPGSEAGATSLEGGSSVHAFGGGGSGGPDPEGGPCEGAPAGTPPVPHAGGGPTVSLGASGGVPAAFPEGKSTGAPGADVFARSGTLPSVGTAESGVEMTPGAAQGGAETGAVVAMEVDGLPVGGAGAGDGTGSLKVGAAPGGDRGLGEVEGAQGGELKKGSGRGQGKGKGKAKGRPPLSAQVEGHGDQALQDPEAGDVHMHAREQEHGMDPGQGQGQGQGQGLGQGKEQIRSQGQAQGQDQVSREVQVQVPVQAAHAHDEDGVTDMSLPSPIIALDSFPPSPRLLPDAPDSEPSAMEATSAAPQDTVGPLGGTQEGVLALGGSQGGVLPLGGGGGEAGTGSAADLGAGSGVVAGGAVPGSLVPGLVVASGEVPPAGEGADASQAGGGDAGVGVGGEGGGRMGGAIGESVSVSGRVNEVGGQAGTEAGAESGGAGAEVAAQELTEQVMINGKPWDVPVTLLDVRNSFGASAILVDASGCIVETDEHGITRAPLQPGSHYTVEGADMAIVGDPSALIPDSVLVPEATLLDTTMQ